MEITDWQQFYDSLVIEPFYGVPVTKPTVAQLDQFEAEAGFRLPQSYRDYILVFGPGRLLKDLDIAAPGYDGSLFWDLQRMQQNMQPREHWIASSPEVDRDRLRRLSYFCSRYKDCYGWDMTEICSSNSSEYAVYRWLEDGRVVRVADSFRGFVENVAAEILAVPDWDEEELGPRMLFEPAARPRETVTGADGRLTSE